MRKMEHLYTNKKFGIKYYSIKFQKVASDSKNIEISFTNPINITRQVFTKISGPTNVHGLVDLEFRS